MMTEEHSDARKAYVLILVALRTERAMREQVLSEPRRSKAIKEMDDALDALQILGEVIRLVIDADHAMASQLPLLDVPGTVYP